MGRGRPKGSKNKVKSSGLIQNNLFNSVPNISVAPVINKSNSNVQANCDLCGAEIYCTPTKVSLSLLTGKASWHRDCKLDRFELCSRCAEELNSVVDNFILTKNPNLNKFI